ncbi:MAG: helix-turn-helix domain-containing protein [Ferrimicrobium sp.]|uniref:Helix-turn-helix domain-containing protein n=1 Tax=Ferrimicrobium acidiphilum TaxID=121039 RepID=A0ABV3Y5I7_9ACTN|nr:helix-turn-helix domain-containing protein [Ferrimicrobium sp.]
MQKWIKRFALYGVGTLADAPRPGTPRTHGDDKITEIIRLTTMTEPPDSSTHWSTNTMAASLHGGIEALPFARHDRPYYERM